MVIAGNDLHISPQSRAVDCSRGLADAAAIYLHGLIVGNTSSWQIA